jgi:hypothetical protein
LFSECSAATAPDNIVRKNSCSCNFYSFPTFVVVNKIDF